jgi:hypothetical protein
MDLNTLNAAVELLKILNKADAKDDGGYFILGASYFIRCLTYHYVGRVKSVLPDGIVLSDASWVADSGRWNHALGTGELNEVEPFLYPVFISIGSIVDATEWPHKLPVEVK